MWKIKTNFQTLRAMRPEKIGVENLTGCCINSVARLLKELFEVIKTHLQPASHFLDSKFAAKYFRVF